MIDIYSCVPQSSSYTVDTINNNPDRAPLKVVLGGQYNYREGGRQALKAAGGVSVVRIRAPKK